jgi:hypothetical protein
VVEGKTYQSWEQIPTSYRVAADRSGKPPSQGLRLLDF